MDPRTTHGPKNCQVVGGPVRFDPKRIEPLTWMKPGYTSFMVTTCDRPVIAMSQPSVTGLPHSFLHEECNFPSLLYLPRFCLHEELSTIKKATRCAHFAIYDGHEGWLAAEYAQKHLHVNVLSLGLSCELVCLFENLVL
ncbi:probable phosphatase 2C 8 isoform X1 [Olea europaea subsp. europaea]|uniref:Probable phosphatase 2C 8 isoform X1 n=1 Tax=Olea europaea subsp. europaea TaxID=158383 RepID=A0A8S0QIC1_OLEEU|nr:probable phosphatase 2C 8 isoform X1 [Olea europaea subsp. europaea]